MDKLKIAILGMGFMGRTHASVLRTMPDAEIVGMCSQPAEDAVRFNRDSGTDCPVYDSFERMLAEVSMDALYVCLPPFAHAGQIEQAAAKGIHIFAEKPLAMDVARAQSIADAVARAGIKSQMGYHMRLGGAVKKLRGLIDSGEAGIPTLFTARYACNSLHAPWWRDAAKCGGQVFEQVIHLYDMGNYLMGPAACVSGFAANLCHQDVPGYTVEDTSAMALRYKSGALGTITGSNCAVPGRWDGPFEAVFENLVAAFEDHNHVTITWTKGDEHTETFKFDTDVRREQNRCFLDVLQGKRPQFAPISEGLAGVKLVSSALKSSAGDGNPVRL